MWRTGSFAAVAATAVTLAATTAACSPSTTTTSGPRSPSPHTVGGGEAAGLLAVNPIPLYESDHTVALKLARGSFQYFRYINRPFVDIICEKYKWTIPTMPLVHAHGDAHIEQYAVAAEGRGLTDFDASAVGPPVVDLVRFATSVVLAAQTTALADRAQQSAREAIAAFVRGYILALENPNVTVEHEPKVATRLRSRFAKTRVEWLDAVQRLILPTPPRDRQLYEAGWADFVSQMRSKDPSIDATFFTIKFGGRLEMGVGSAHAEKFLARIEGPTSTTEDDLIIEVKAVTPDMLGKCMQGVSLDATRVIKGQAQISNAPQRFLAAVKINGKPFYSHSWLVHYTELAVTDFQTPDELGEVSEEIGIQLGRGHGKTEDVAHAQKQRRALKAALETIAPTLSDVAIELATAVTNAWSDYCAHLPNRIICATPPTVSR